MMRQRFAPQVAMGMGDFYGGYVQDYGYGEQMYGDDQSMMMQDKAAYGRTAYAQQQQQFNPYAAGNYDYTEDSMGFDESNGFAIGGGMW